MCLGREPETGGYSVFLVAIEGFVYQEVEFTQRYIQIMNGKCDQMRPIFQERDQMRPKILQSLLMIMLLYSGKKSVSLER